MARIFDRSELAYILARTPRIAQTFARKRNLPHYVILRQIEDIPRKKGLNVIVVGEYWKHPEYELFFTSNFMVDFKAWIFYEREVV